MYDEKSPGTVKNVRWVHGGEADAIAANTVGRRCAVPAPMSRVRGELGGSAAAAAAGRGDRRNGGRSWEWTRTHTRRTDSIPGAH